MWTWATFQSDWPQWLAGPFWAKCTALEKYTQLLLRQHSSFTALNTEWGENRRESIIQRPQSVCVYNWQSMEKQCSEVLELRFRSTLETAVRGNSVWSHCHQVTHSEMHTHEACVHARSLQLVFDILMRRAVRSVCSEEQSGLMWHSACVCCVNASLQASERTLSLKHTKVRHTPAALTRNHPGRRRSSPVATGGVCQSCWPGTMMSHSCWGHESGSS